MSVFMGGRGEPTHPTPPASVAWLGTYAGRRGGSDGEIEAANSLNLVLLLPDENPVG